MQRIAVVHFREARDCYRCKAVHLLPIRLNSRSGISSALNHRSIDATVDYDDRSSSIVQVHMGQRINYVLIDYESVQPDLLSALHDEHFRLMVFVGATQSKVAFDTAAALQRLGERATYVKIAGTGPNALDFHIAFYIGQFSAQTESPYFHIISRDKGFDPLIQHLKDRKIPVARWQDVAEIPLLKVSNAKSQAEKVAVIVEYLKARGSARPRKLKTLTNTIVSLFQKQLPDDELRALVDELQAQGFVATSGLSLSYSLPA